MSNGTNNGSTQTPAIYFVTGAPHSLFFPMPAGGFLWLTEKQIMQRMEQGRIEVGQGGNLGKSKAMGEWIDLLRDFFRECSDGTACDLKGLRTVIIRMADKENLVTIGAEEKPKPTIVTG